jgi:hypothetical protein
MLGDEPHRALAEAHSRYLRHDGNGANQEHIVPETARAQKCGEDKNVDDAQEAEKDNPHHGQPSTSKELAEITLEIINEPVGLRNRFFHKVPRNLQWLWDESGPGPPSPETFSHNQFN